MVVAHTSWRFLILRRALWRKGKRLVTKRAKASQVILDATLGSGSFLRRFCAFVGVVGEIGTFCGFECGGMEGISMQGHF